MENNLNGTITSEVDERHTFLRLRGSFIVISPTLVFLFLNENEMGWGRFLQKTVTQREVCEELMGIMKMLNLIDVTLVMLPERD